MKYIMCAVIVLAIAACSSTPVQPIGGHCNDVNYPQCVQTSN